MFKGFDFGKGLMRQVDNFRRANPQQQKRKEAGLLRALEKYTTRYMNVIEKPGGANPGLLKNGAEVLVEAAHALKETTIIYQAFADLVLRSRKVPVVPGLASLVDRLLELPSDLKDERVSLLSWRITTGSMRPERLLPYLAERAKLTGESVHWKDFVWGLSQLLKKDEIGITDEITTTALTQLLANLGKIGDRGVFVQLLAARSKIESGEVQAAEGLLIDIGIDRDSEPPEGYVETVEHLVAAYPKAEWGLHSLVLQKVIEEFKENSLSWTTLREKLNYSQDHREGLVEFLLAEPLMPQDERLADYTLRQLLRMDDPRRAAHLVERWVQIMSKDSEEWPEAADELIRNAYAAGRLPKDIDLEKVLKGDSSALESIRRELEEEDRARQQREAEERARIEAEAEKAETIEADSGEIEGEVPEPGVEPDGKADDTSDEVGEDTTENADQAQVIAGEAEELEQTAAEGAEEDEPEAELDSQEAVVAEPELETEDADENVLAAELDGQDAATADTEIDAEEAEADADEAVEADRVAGEEDADADDAVEPGDLEDSSDEAPTGIPIAACKDAGELVAELNRRYTDGLTAETAHVLLDELNEEDAEKWLVDASCLWCADALFSLGETVAAIEMLEAVTVQDVEAANQMINLVTDAVEEDDLPPEGWALLAKLSLLADNYTAAYEYAVVLPEDYPSRSQLLTALETWIVSQHEPPPEMLMVLARLRRQLSDDPEAGFEPATTASLLGRDNPAIQEAYQTWVTALEPEVVHDQRARLATYLCANEGQSEILPLAINEIEQLAAALPADSYDTPLDLLDQLRPVLGTVPADQGGEVRVQWTRQYLQLMSHSSDEQLTAAAVQAAHEIEPHFAISLASELGMPVPAGAMLMVEYETLVKQGEWQAAVALLDDVEVGGPSLVPIKLLCDNLDSTALHPAATHLCEFLAGRDDQASRLELVRSLDARLEADSGIQDAKEVRNLADNMLLEMSRSQYQPAIKYLFESNRNIGEPVEVLRNLLILVRNGDTQALEGLRDALVQLLPEGEPADLIIQAADEVANACHDESPEQALDILSRAGLATGRAQYAADRIKELDLPLDSPAAIELRGRLALGTGNEDQALELITELAEMGSWHEARNLAFKAVEELPESVTLRRELIQQLLGEEGRDLDQATRQVFRLAQVCHEADLNLSETLGDLGDRIEEILGEESTELAALKLKFAVRALAADYDRTTELIDTILSLGDEATNSLLGLFEDLAIEDAEMPASLVVTWGRVLFKAGRTTDALDRLAGLREAVGDYPEYTALLKEIRDSEGGPGASMQLGEAYLRVNLWQRSAEEYALALGQDSSLATPIMTQLRHHDALEPNQMLYPLHLLGLRCVAHSDKIADWGWALSAMNWLLPRWSAEELYGLTIELWNNVSRIEMEEPQQIELLMHMFKLSNKLGQVEDAVGYLSKGWGMLSQPNDELLDALEELDRSKLAKDSAVWLEIYQYELEAAVLKEDSQAVLNAAQSLAAAGEEGRDLAQRLLAEYQREVEDAAPILLARLQLLDIKTDEGRQQFIDELLKAAETDLPISEVHSLIRTVLNIVEETAGGPELNKLLLQLFQQLGDEARAWEMALCFIDGKGELTDLSMEILVKLAQDEYAQQLRLTLLEVHVLRREYAQALSLLEEIETGSLGENGAFVAGIAESLLDTESREKARGWLVDYYCHENRLAEAADHLVWAHAAGNELPVGWLMEQTSGELLYRAAVLKENAGDKESARQLFGKAHHAGFADRFIKTAVSMHLSRLHEESGDLARALEYNAEVLTELADHLPSLRRTERLTREIRLNRIGDLRKEPESSRRTIELAQLMCLVDDPLAAINELQAGIGRGETEPEIYVELAECFIVTRDFAIARRAFDEVIRRLDTGTDDMDLRLRALYGLATAVELLGDRDSAVRCLEQILVLKHNYRDSRQRLEDLAGGKRQGSKHARETAEGKQEILSEILSMLGKPTQDEDGDDK